MSVAKLSYTLHNEATKEARSDDASICFSEGYTLSNLDFTFFINNITNNMPALTKFQANSSLNLISYTTLRRRAIGVTPNFSF